MSDYTDRPYWLPDGNSFDVTTPSLLGKPSAGIGLLSGNSSPSLPMPSFGSAPYGAGLLSSGPPSTPPQLQTPSTLAGILSQGGPVPSPDFTSLQFDPGPMPSPVPGLLGPFAGQGQSPGMPQPGLLSLSSGTQGFRGLLASGSNDGTSDPNGPPSYGQTDPSAGPQAPPRTYYPRDMTISDAGINHIRNAEGHSRNAYSDDAGNPTNGIGHLLLPGESTAPWTDDHVEEQFHNDLNTAQRAVRSLVRVPLTQDQFDMLTSLAINVGRGGIAKSNMLKNLNDGDYVGAATNMLTFDHAKGQIDPGLTTRRRLEAGKFLGPDLNLLPQDRPSD